MDDEQSQLWNGPSGRAWIDGQRMLDEMFAPIERLLADFVVATGARNVLDIGCGTGSTTLAAARAMGARGTAVGLDISAPMIEVARASAQQEGAPARFIAADARDFAFEPASFDAMISRFGVMFFGDSVGAFRNLHRAAKPGAALRAIAWRSPAENPFMTTAERAAAPLLPELPPRKQDGPGQFAFADRDRVISILSESGWKKIDVHPLDVPCVFTEPDLNIYLTRLGPIAAFLQAADEQLRAKATKAIRAAFDPFVEGGKVRFNAACWQIDASA